MSNISDEELNELTCKVEFMLTQLDAVQSFVNKLHKRVDNGDFDNTNHGMSLLDVKFHLLLMYCTRLCLYISMRCQGESVANHELLNQLAICSWILDKLRSIQKQCQYSVDKLLDHAKSAINNNNSNNNKLLTVNDELSHKPDLNTLRPPNVNESNPMDIDHETEINKDGIYRPLKLNPTLMDTPQNIITRKQERQLEQFKKSVRNSEIYEATKDKLTNLPREEKVFLENVDKFARRNKNDNKKGSKSKLKDMENYEENNYGRLKKSRFEMKRSLRKKRLKESSIGENLNSFIDGLDESFKKAQVLGDFEAGAKFSDTIGKHTKKHLKGGKYIKGPWQKRQKILFKRSKKGQKIESRKKWRKAHPLKTNPAKAARMKQHKFKKSGKVKKLLRKLK